MVSKIIRQNVILKVLAGLSLAVIVYYVFIEIGWDGLTTKQSRKMWRQKILVIYHDVNLGMTKKQVEEIIHAHHWPEELQYQIESFLLLNSPMEMGSQNWFLNIELDKKEKVIGIKIRTTDGPKPANSPEDKLTHKSR
jgi:hypothetical protein